MSEKYIPFTPQDCAILRIGHQPGVMGMVKSLSPGVVAANVGILARLGEHTAMPLVVTTIREQLDYIGTSIEEIRNGAPAAYANRVARGGVVDAFADPRFVEAVKATDRQNLIMAGILTDVYLWHSALSALDAGYRVRVIADANGTTSELADRVTYHRLRSLGAEVSSTYGTLFELYMDFTTPEGQLAEAIAAGQDLTTAA